MRSAWTTKQIEFLRHNFWMADKAALIAGLPTHPIQSIMKKGYSLGLKRARVPRESIYPVVRGLVQARLKKGITRMELSNILGYHEFLIGRWERGDAKPNIKRLHDWAQALGFEIVLKLPDA